ncbi:hypothetical protein LTR87_014960 [Friedmanniomyces endolithicus]|nr:hypothetical protein LTR87_014960 [Friedmanniomyces endolithicus]
MCNATEQLGYVLNQYYVAQSSGASACAFNGAAQTKSPSSASGACASLVSQAGTAGTGTVTSVPSGSGGSGSSGSSGSGSGASGSASKGAAGLSRHAAVETGLLPVALMRSDWIWYSAGASMDAARVCKGGHGSGAEQTRNALLETIYLFCMAVIMAYLAPGS